MTGPVRLRPIPVWHGRWGPEELRKQKTSGQGGARAYRRGFELIALADDEKAFPDFAACRGVVSIPEIRRARWPTFSGVDLAGDKRPGNVIFTIAVDPHTRKRYPVEVRHGAWKPHETAQQIAEVDRLWNPLVIMVENNGYQGALLDFCQASPEQYGFWMKLEPTTTGANKVSPVFGLPSLQVEFHARSWVIPWNEYEHHSPGPHVDNTGRPCGWCLWDYEMQNYPLSATTDTIMACWFARQGIELFGTVVDVRNLNLTQR